MLYVFESLSGTSKHKDVYSILRNPEKMSSIISLGRGMVQIRNPQFDRSLQWKYNLAVDDVLESSGI